MSELLRHIHGRLPHASTLGVGRPSFALLVVVVALLAGACSTSAATAETGEDCLLGLDLWDTDPALTWIQDGKVWVRAGDRQACLSHTDASDMQWGPDGRRLLLDDGLFEAGAATAYAAVPEAQQVVWHEPFGETIHIVDENGAVVQVVGDQALESPGVVSLVATHPDGAHVAAVTAAGTITLSGTDGAASADLLQLTPGESVVQMQFAPDASRLWLLIDLGSKSQVTYVDLLPISNKLEIEPVEAIVPGLELPVPELYFIDVDLADPLPPLEMGIGAVGADITRFALHPAHRDWVGVTEGLCAEASSSFFVDGDVSATGLPGAVVGFFRGGGEPILATTSAGEECGKGQLWVVDGLPGASAATLIADEVSSADIRDQAPDPWNPNTAPPFA